MFVFCDPNPALLFKYVNVMVISSKLNSVLKLIRSMSTKTHCYLINLDTKKRIDLPHMIPITLGRNKNTEIKDVTVSRKQIICFSDTTEHKVVLKPVGNALSGCNGLALSQGLIYTIGFKDIIEVSLGNHKFEVMFDPEPAQKQDLTSSIEEPKPKKPKLDFPIFDTQKPSMSSESLTAGTWEEIDNRELLIFTPANCVASSKIASFDVDGTIIKTKSGARFPKTPDDWTWNIVDIKKHMKKLTENDYKLVFFTNQSGVGNDSSKIKGYKKKIEDIVRGLGVPVQVFISLGKGLYRKPRMGMWNSLVKDKNEGVDIDVMKSFFVGDAAGREKNWMPKKNKDHSAADRLFAMNIGLKFYTPEEYFLKQKPAPFKMPEFDPRVDTDHLQYPDLSYDKLNIVLMVGGPGSGKSSFIKHLLLPKGYVHVSRDLLGSWQKCVRVMEENLGKKKNVVVDNTNVDKETRQRFIQAAKKFDADVRCFVMETTLMQIRHNNKFREITDKSHAVVSDIIIYSYKKNYEEPEMSEGYSQIVKIPFITKFTDKSQEKLYKTFLLD